MNEQLKTEIRQAIEVLKRGGIILYPTDTIWGIGCDATNEEAVRRIYALKQREDTKAMLILLDHPGRLATYVDVPEVAYNVIEVSDKPITIIYPHARNLAKNLIAQDGTVGIRITTELFSRTLIEHFRKPIVSTSVNISGQPAPGCFSEIAEELKQQVDYVVNYRREEKTTPTPSSIIKLGMGGEVQIIRY